MSRLDVVTFSVVLAQGVLNDMEVIVVERWGSSPLSDMPCDVAVTIQNGTHCAKHVRSIFHELYTPLIYSLFEEKRSRGTRNELQSGSTHPFRYSSNTVGTHTTRSLLE